jgi:hypothetical protein
MRDLLFGIANNQAYLMSESSTKFVHLSDQNNAPILVSISIHYYLNLGYGESF